MSVRILGSVHTLAHFVRQHLPSLPAFRPTSVSIQGNDLMPVISATQALLTRLVSYIISALTLAKGLLFVIYAAADLCIVATATVIKNVVGARGSRFMNSVWSVICRLKGSISDVRS